MNDLIRSYTDRCRGMSINWYGLKTEEAKEIMERGEESTPALLETLRGDGGMFIIALLEAMYPEANPYDPEPITDHMVGYNVPDACRAWIEWGIKNGYIEA